MIEVVGLSKRFGDRTAIDRVSFTAVPGQILGFLGPNGAGKTTTMRVITGYLPATEGTVKVAGYDVFEQSAEVRRRIGYLPENPPLYDEMSVVPYLRFAAKLRGVRRAALDEALDRVIEACTLRSVTDRMLGHLSKGYRQRVGLAQALIHDPEVLILDEPTNGLDPGQIDEMLGFIRGLAPNRTIVLSTHILGQVLETCQKVVIISDGRVVVEDELANLTRNQRLEDAYRRAIAGERPATPAPPDQQA
jgi:ABC-2 type transport system ATP-binding protein